MRHILQLDGLNVSSELGVTVFIMDVSRMCKVVPVHAVIA